MPFAHGSFEVHRDLNGNLARSHYESDGRWGLSALPAGHEMRQLELGLGPDHAPHQIEEVRGLVEEQAERERFVPLGQPALRIGQLSTPNGADLTKPALSKHPAQPDHGTRELEVMHDGEHAAGV